MKPVSPLPSLTELLARLTPEELESSGDLEPLSPAARLALWLAPRPDTGPRDIIGVVQRDQGIKACMLHLVNSSLFGLNRRIEDLGEAGSYLGCKQLADVACTAAYASQHACMGFLHPSQAQFLWRRSMAVALCSASHSPNDFEPSTFLVGLFEGLGLLWMTQRLPDRFLRRLHQLYFRGCESERAQHVVLRTTYCAKSAQILSTWKFPEVYVHVLEKLSRGQIDCPTTEAVHRGRKLAATLIDTEQVPETIGWCMPSALCALNRDEQDNRSHLLHRYSELSVLPKAA